MNVKINENRIIHAGSSFAEQIGYRVLVKIKCSIWTPLFESQCLETSPLAANSETLELEHKSETQE